MRWILFLCLLTISVAAKADTQPCMYVNSPDGLNIYQYQSLNSKIIGVLSFGTRVDDYQTSGDTVFDDNGKQQQGKWYKIRHNNIEGYIVGVHVRFNRTTVPDSTLYLFNHLYINNFSIDYSGYENYREGDHYCDQLNVVPPYYPNLGYGDTAIQAFKNLEASILDTLKTYIKLELVNIDDYKQRVVKNKYEPDYTSVEKYIYPESWNSPFYVPIKNGKDTVEFHNIETEVTTYVKYIGQIPYLNWYLIGFCYEECGIGLYSSKDGKAVAYKGSDDFIYSGAGGVPQISPNAKYMVDYSLGFYGNCYFSINKLHGIDSTEQILQVNLISWVPDMYHNEVFWLSDNELILRVLPIDLYSASQNIFFWDGAEFNKEAEFHYQYIKLTIL